MLSRIVFCLFAGTCLSLTGCATTPTNSASGPGAVVVGKPGPVLENLMTSELEGADGKEVVLSRVTIPSNTTLPKHWHPGEEFAYVMDGSVTLWQEGKRNVRAKKGDTVKVPYKQVHTAITGEEGVTLLVFRVHEKGQPERVPAG